MCLDDRRTELFATSATLFRNYPFVHSVVSGNNEGYSVSFVSLNPLQLRFLCHEILFQFLEQVLLNLF